MLPAGSSVVVVRRRLRMKARTGIAMLMLYAVTVVVGCTNREDASGDAVKQDTAKGKPAEVVAIEKTIVDLAKSMTDFPKTRDKQTVLRFFAKDYVAFQDGEEANVEETERNLSDLLERINLGEPIGISNEVTNINVRTSGVTVWATYDFSYKLGRGGVPVQQMEGKCTAVLKKERENWVFQHEHCSSHTERPQRELQDALIRGLLR
jgi:ketosteroid isomerase-like protein